MNPVFWPGHTPYPAALAQMDVDVAAVLVGGQEQLIFCEHASVFTTGTGGDMIAEVLSAGDIPVFPTGRGGKTTYHGPGQRVVYPIINLAQRDMQDLKGYIAALQNVVIGALEDLGVQGTAKSGDELGVWVATPNGDAKIAAFGVRVRRWVAFHGLALNVNPNMEHFARILPCGLHKPVTSLHALGLTCSMDEVDEALLNSWQQVFGPLEG